VSNPELDFAGSVFAGFAQSTSSSARCGNSVVVGFEDTGALLNSNGASFDGVSFSIDGGNSFLNWSLLNPGSDPTAILAGDPVVACSSPKVFYYASILLTGSGTNTLMSISVSTSGDGGRNWGAPIPVVTGSLFGVFFDKPWLAIDPSNPLQLYVTFMDASSMSVQVVSSKDGGITWSAPVVLEKEINFCPNAFIPFFPSPSGPNVIVGPGGEVYVAFEVVYPSCDEQNFVTPPREIHFARSVDHGATFSPASKLSDVIGNGSPFLPGSFSIGAVSVMEGGFFINEYPQLAVDRSNGASRGTLYVTWSDGRNDVRPDILGVNSDRADEKTYAYPDILIIKSTDKGLSFSAPVAVSPRPAGFSGPGRDQFFPGIAVDPIGKVAVCYYDRRNDPSNMAIDRYCSVSLNHGATWQDLRASRPSWVPYQSDFFMAGLAQRGIGEYDTLTSDFTLMNLGFFAAFQVQEDGNPNIVAKKF
jgi:hypothetical protein